MIVRRGHALLAALLCLGVCQSGAVLADATYSWGNNDYGQLGTGNFSNTESPALVDTANMPPLIGLAAGFKHSYALAADGFVYAWGGNWVGQLGDGTYQQIDVPVQVALIDDAVAIASGGVHGLAVRQNGTVVAWGANSNGQLGDGTNTDSPVPVAVTGLTDVVAVAASNTMSYALKSDGTVWAWGWNGYGQLGNGTVTDSNVPLQVSGLTNVVAISAGHYHCIALKSDGTVWGWGSNLSGQLGTGSSDTSNTPVQVLGVVNATAIAAGFEHNLALTIDGTVLAWGSNQRGEIGDGQTGLSSAPPVQVANLTNVVAIASGPALCSFAITADGSAWAWGNNDNGQFGDGTYDSSAVPVPVGLPGVTALAVGAQHVLAFANAAQDTQIIVADRAGSPEELITLSAQLQRVSDGSGIGNAVVHFSMDGTDIGSGTTDATGSATVNWVIADGPAQRTIGASFAGDAQYAAASATGTFTTVALATRLWVADRTQRIGGLTELKARLVRSDNAPVAGKDITFRVDGTVVGTAPTDANGYARYASYMVPNGSGTGSRAIVAEWSGSGGYLPSSRAATLTVLKSLPNIWVLPRTVAHGANARLYAYFRSMPGYHPLEGKPVTFKVDGTWIADVVTGSGADAGIARYLYTTVEPPGTHTIRCEFAGDAWVDAGNGEASLTIY